MDAVVGHKEETEFDYKKLVYANCRSLPISGRLFCVYESQIKRLALGIVLAPDLTSY